MNSMSRGFHNPCKKEECQKVFCREEEREEKCPTIVKCGCPSSTPINRADKETTFIVASLTLDTSCICDPSIKLEFASNIVISNNEGGDEKVSLNFRVFKQCKHQENKVPVGGVWNFLTGEDDISTTFSFFVCDTDSCFDDCCTYTVVATVADKLHHGTLSVNNATLGAVASCRKTCHECRRDHDRDCHKRRRDCDEF